MSTDELLELAAKVPMPIRYRGLVDVPWPVTGGTGSASAGVASGSANPQPVG